MDQDYNSSTSKHSIMLHDALISRGINAILEYNDVHKTVDVAVLEAKLFI